MKQTPSTTNLTGLVYKAIDSAISVKFFVMILSSVLFYIGKLTQDGWMTIVLSTTGMRLANELSSMYKDIRVSQAENSVPVPKGKK